MRMGSADVVTSRVATGFEGSPHPHPRGLETCCFPLFRCRDLLSLTGSVRFPTCSRGFSGMGCVCVCAGWVVSIFAASKIHHFQINKEGSPATFSIKMDSGRVVSHASVDALIEYFCADTNAG